ncbi:DEAD-domain-containing protein [Saccharata proteae CBS 121410]|uniref:ATP-dependent RNA helicase n=1 Tax=Saccharata proteae CBS 121410 TaxID=1314787 RepID=A0A9P4HNP8_9PEZI|nr:DEAD-domain-containing protein [Saccharata proteae CBS 121410]
MPPPPGVSEGQPFASMQGKLHPDLLAALNQLGYETMSPVQSRVLNELPTFKDDCLVQAKTGTGKTIAFLLPALHTLLTERARAPRGNVSVLVLSPTRELASQIAKECDSLTQKKISCHVAVGGTSKEKDLKRFLSPSEDPKLLAATPGRLQDYLSDPAVASKFANLQTVILDEADTMLDSGFINDLKKILRILPSKAANGWQGMCFSATMPPSVHDVLHHVLRPGCLQISTIDKNETPTVDKIPQFHLVVPSITDTIPGALGILKEELGMSPDGKLKAIIFSSTARGANLMYEIFKDLPGLNLPAFQMHSRMTQASRTKVTMLFKEATSGLLFASDVVGRGMDFPNVGLVVQMGVPSSAEQYVHRVGRTGRAGTSGRAVIVLTKLESNFLSQNRSLPVSPYALANSPAMAPLLARIAQVDPTLKAQAYSAFLGYNKDQAKRVLKTDVAEVVRIANEWVQNSLGYGPEPPAMEAKTIGKMGLKGVPGIRIAPKSRGGSGGRGGGGGGRGGGGPRRDGMKASSPTMGGGVQKNRWSGRGSQASRGGRGGRGGRGSD